MRVLSRIWPEHGHFPWCPKRGEHAKGCSRCKLHFYIFALFATALVAGTEFVGSGLTRSESLFADAWHMVSDSLGYAIGIIAARFAVRPVQKGLEAVTAGLVMLAGVYMLLGSAVNLLRGNPSALLNTGLLLGIAGLGLGINLLLIFLMRALRVEHAHGHTHAHRDGVLEGNIAHTIADAAASVGVLLNAALSRYFGAVPWIGYCDLFLSMVIAGWLTYQGWHILDHMVLGHNQDHHH